MEDGSRAAIRPKKDVAVELGLVCNENLPPAFATKKIESKVLRPRPILSWWMALSRDAPDGIGVAGLKYVLISRESRHRRLGWICILMVAMTALIWQIGDRGMYFSTYPLSVDIHLNQTANELTFPKVIICNINMYQKSKVEAQPAVDKVLRSYENSNYKPNETIELTPEELAHVLTINTTYFQRDVAQGKQDMFLRVTFGGKPVDLDDIVPVQTSSGRCYQINDGLDGRRLLQSQGGGKIFDLSLILNTHQEEYYINRFMRDSAGFTILLLDQDETHSLFQEGLFVGPGTYAAVEITANQQHNARPPYGVCGEKKLHLFDKYSQTKCFSECTAEAVVAKCGCRAPSLPGTAPVCDPITVAVCSTAFFEPGEEYAALHSREYSTCPIDCDKKTFSVSLSTAKYPTTFRAELFEEYFKEGLLDLPGLKSINRSYIEQNFVAVDLFFSDTSTTVITQRAAYPFMAFMCDIGGSIGLWLGGSLLTIYEILDLCGHSFFSRKY